MILYNIKELEKRLIEKTLTEKEVFNYLLTWFVLGAILSYPMDNPTSYPWIHWIDITIDLIVTVIGIKLTWINNSKGDNVDYFTRFISLAFVNIVRVGVKVFGIGVIISITADLLLPDNYLTGIQQGIFNISIVLIFQIIFYFRLNNSFKNVSGHRTSE